MWPERKVTEPELQELHLALAASEIPPGLDRIVRELLEECRGYREALDIAERAPHVREELVAALAGAKSED